MEFNGVDIAIYIIIGIVVLFLFSLLAGAIDTWWNDSKFRKEQEKLNAERKKYKDGISGRTRI